MNKKPDPTRGAKAPREYDFSRGTRGKYASRYDSGTNVVVLDADVAKAFPTNEAVNVSLRGLASLIHQQRELAEAKK
jgi:hypothetical protein